MSLQIGFNDPIKITWNIDEQGNKTSIKMQPEGHVVANNRITLIQIPDIFYRVEINENIIHNDPTTKVNEYNFYEISDNQSPLNLNNFRVDYQSGIITFHPSQEGKTITVTKYYGRGVILTPSSRIYSKLDAAGNVTETVQDLIDAGQGAIEEFAQVVATIGSANQLYDKMNLQIDETEMLQTELISNFIVADEKNSTLISTIEDSINKNTTLNNTINNANITNSTLNTTINNANVKDNELNDTILNANDTDTTLNNTIDTANTTNSTLNTTIDNADIKDNELNTTITNAQTKDTELQATIDDSIIKNTTLNNTIVDSINKDTVLKATIQDSVAKNNTLNATIDDSVVKDTALNTTINDSATKDVALNTTIANSVTRNNELNITIQDSIVKNNTLNTTISDSIIKKDDLNLVIINSTTKKNELDTTIDLANTTKTNLDTSITNAESIEYTLDQKVQDILTSNPFVEKFIATANQQQFVLTKGEYKDYPLTHVYIQGVNIDPIDDFTLIDDGLNNKIFINETLPSGTEVKVSVLATLPVSSDGIVP